MEEVMSRHSFPLPDLVVGTGVALSNVLTEGGAPVAPAMTTDGNGFRDADSITIEAPAVLAEVATIQVAEKEVGGAFNNLQRAGADVTVAAGKAITIADISFKALQISLGVVAAATRTFKVTKGVRVYG